MLCSGSQTRVEGWSLHQNHITAASFMPCLGQCLVEKEWFYGTLGKEHWKPWIFSLKLFLSKQKWKLLLGPGTFTPELQQALHSCPELVLLSSPSRVPQLKTGKENVMFFSFLCSTHLQSQMECVGLWGIKDIQISWEGGNFYEQFFGRLSYFIPPGLIVWLFTKCFIAL